MNLVAGIAKSAITNESNKVSLRLWLSQFEPYFAISIMTRLGILSAQQNIPVFNKHNVTYQY